MMPNQPVKCPQNVPKMSPKCPQNVPKMSPKCPQNVPKCLQNVSKYLYWDIFPLHRLHQSLSPNVLPAQYRTYHSSSQTCGNFHLHSAGRNVFSSPSWYSFRRSKTSLQLRTKRAKWCRFLPRIQNGRVEKKGQQPVFLRVIQIFGNL